MTLNSETAWILRAGTSAGLIIMAVGLLLSSFEFSNYLLNAGVLVLIFTPPAGILVSTKCLIQEKDWYWVKVAVLLIVIVAAGAVFSYFF